MTDAPMDKSGLGAGIETLLADLKKGRDRRETTDPVWSEFNRHIQTVEALSPSPAIGEQGAVAWRDMTTAPKDASPVLIRRETMFPSEEGYHVVRWDDVDGGWIVHDGKNDHPLRGPEPSGWLPLDERAPPAVACLPERALIHDLTAARDGCQDGLARVSRSLIVRALDALSAPPSAPGVEDDEALRDAWSDFEDEHLIGPRGGWVGKPIWEACRAAFYDAWPQDPKSAVKAASEALASTAPQPREIGQ